MCVGVSGFGVPLHSAISTLTLATFVLATDSTRSQFNDCCFLIGYQVTVRYKYSKWPSSESVHEWTRLIMDCHTL